MNKTRAQVIRPTLSRLGDSVCALWTETNEKQLAHIYFSQRKKGAWSQPTVISSPEFAAQNQEVAVDKNGKLFVVWQEFRDGQYDVMSKIFLDGKWSSPVALTKDKYDDWDPMIACDSKGGMWLAWTSYRDGDYDLFLRQINQGDVKEIRLGARGEYDLHPSLAADTDGRVWIAWDSVTVSRHGASGGMTITGANLKRAEGEKEMNDPENPDQKPLVAQVRLACIENGKLLQILKASKSIQPPDEYKLAHTALPKILFDKNGTLWVAYRALTTEFGPEGVIKTPEPKKKKERKRRLKAKRQRTIKSVAFIGGMFCPVVSRWRME